MYRKNRTGRDFILKNQERLCNDCRVVVTFRRLGQEREVMSCQSALVGKSNAPFKE